MRELDFAFFGSRSDNVLKIGQSGFREEKPDNVKLLIKSDHRGVVCGAREFSRGTKRGRIAIGRQL